MYKQWSVETLLNNANFSKPSDCGNCADLDLQLLQSLYELGLCLKNVFVIFNSFTDSSYFCLCPLLLILPDHPQLSTAEIKSKWIYTPKPTLHLHGLRRANLTCLRLRPHICSVAFSLLRAAHTDVQFCTCVTHRLQFCTRGTHCCADLYSRHTLPINNAINKRHSLPIKQPVTNRPSVFCCT
jgi:hypothetical protein